MSAAQGLLFHETLADALASAVHAIGGFKRAASLLWPTVRPERAYSRLKACLDEGDREKLELCDIVALARHARDAGDHSVMRFLAHELGYAEPQPITPNDQTAALQSQFVAAVAQLETIQRAMGRVGGRK